jgi:uncharacterized membrane protein
MKILIYVVGFIVTCFIGFYVIGLVKPTIIYESKITINRPVQQTWAVFSNEKLLAQWMQGFDHLEKIKSEPFQSGAEYKLFLKEKNQVFEINHKIINAIPSKKYEYTLDNAVLQNHVIITFSEPQQFTTEIVMANEVNAKNWFLRSLFVFFKSQFKSQDELNLEALKRLVELDPELVTGD